MNWLTHAQLRRDTSQARQLAFQLIKSAQWNSGHDLVWNLFADDAAAHRSFLYRELDQGDFLVLSQTRPSGSDAVWSLQTKPFAPQIDAGQTFGFSLRVNPTVSRSVPDRGRSRRDDVLMAAKHAKGAPLTAQEREDAALGWLYAREERLGVRFQKEHCRTGQQTQLNLAHGGEPIRLTSIDYEGVLKVVDPSALLEALQSGVGRGKAYGMGLLLLHTLGA